MTSRILEDELPERKAGVGDDIGRAATFRLFRAIDGGEADGLEWLSHPFSV